MSTVESVKAFKRVFKAALKANGKLWDALYARGVNVDELTYDGDAVDEAFKVLFDTAKVVDKVFRRKLQ
jgi:hypothetical protein